MAGNKKIQLTARQRKRLKRSFPFGMLTALLTAAFVTLVGVFLGLEPLVILTRATVSSFVIGALVSLGLSIVQMADAEYKNRHPASRN